MGHLTFLSKRLSAVGNKRISQFFASACEPRSRVIALVDSTWVSLRSWRDFVRECFCFGSEAVNARGEAVRGLVKSRVEFPPAQISGVF